MYEKIKSMLPKELLESGDVSMFRQLREFADSEVQELKRKDTERNLDKYVPMYVGKYILEYGHLYHGPNKVDNTNDINIVRVHAVKSVGIGFLSCKATVLGIKYGGVHKQIATGKFDVAEYDDIQVCTYVDEDYRFSLDRTPHVLTAEEVSNYMNQARIDISNSMTWFTEQVKQNEQ